MLSNYEKMVKVADKCAQNGWVARYSYINNAYSVSIDEGISAWISGSGNYQLYAECLKNDNKRLNTINVMLQEIISEVFGYKLPTPTDKMITYAKKISDKLNLKEPDYNSYEKTASFIERHAERYSRSFRRW